MNRLIVTIQIFFIAMLFTGADAIAQFHVSSKWHNDTYTYKRKDGFSSLEVNFKGEVQVNDTDTDITSISPGGFLKINQTTFGNKRTIIMEGGSGGKLSRTYYEGRKEHEFDNEAKQWLSEILIQVIRATGIAAESRVNRIYKKGGSYAVLKEIREINSNSGKGRYFDALLAKPNLKDVGLIAEKMGAYITSNSTRGSLFRKHAERFMKNEASTKAMFRGISKMTSNTERGSLLKHLIDSYQLTDAHYEGIFDVLRRMTSNTERGSVLRILNDKMSTNPSIINAYGSVINGMTSNTEKSSVLRDLIREEPKPEIIKMCLNSLMKFTSNTEMGNVLRVAAPYMKGSDELLEAYLLAVRRMTSNTEMGNALHNLLRNNQIKSTNSKVMLLEATRRMTSNTERGNILRKCVDLLNQDSRVNQAFFDSVNGLTSNTERGSVLRAVATKPGLDKITIIGILDSTRGMTSNSEIGNVLATLSRVMPKNDTEIKSAYKSAAARLTSDSEYRRVINLID